MGQSPKMVFVKPLKSNAQALLSRPILKPAYRIGDPKIMLNVRLVFDYLRMTRPLSGINYQHACCPAGATFSERSLGKSLETHVLVPFEIRTNLPYHYKISNL